MTIKLKKTISTSQNRSHIMNQQLPQEQDASSEIFTEKDFHCIARMLQGAFYKHDQLYCCKGYCLYSNECSEQFKKNNTMHFNVVRNKLTNVTGVYNRLVYDDMEKCMMEHSYFASVSQNNSKQGS